MITLAWWQLLLILLLLLLLVEAVYSFVKGFITGFMRSRRAPEPEPASVALPWIGFGDLMRVVQLAEEQLDDVRDLGDYGWSPEVLAQHERSVALLRVLVDAGKQSSE